MRAPVIAPVLVMALILAACAQTSGQRLADVARGEAAVYYVENHGKDKRHLDEVIAAVLRSYGFDARSGEDRPDAASYVVSYEDRWQWDMRMYLLELKIAVRDAETGETMGTGRSYQDSLAAMGKTHEDIVKRAVTALLEGS